MKNAGANISVSRLVAAAVSLVTPLVVVELNPARAAGTCDTAAPVNNAAVDCFGGTITANDPNGWGTGTETGDTITVESDAALHGNNAGIFVKDATIINQGSIAGAVFGILFNSASIASSVTNGANDISGGTNAINAAGDLTVKNDSGKIFSNGAAGIGILAGGAATIDNAQGQITGDLAAIKAFTINIKSNEGIIEAFATPNASNLVAAVWATGGDVFVHNGHGNIHALSTGAAAIQSDSGTVTIDANDGDISGGGAAISAHNVTVRSNNGNITALDTTDSSVAIAALNGKAAVTNGNSSGVNSIISGDAFGILAATLDIKNFRGATISSAHGVGIEGSGDVVTAGTISGATKSVNFSGAAGATNTLTLQEGAVLIGAAVGSVGATNNLILQGSGTANNDFQNFNSLTLEQSARWTLNGNSVVGATTLGFDTELTVGDGGHRDALLTGDVTLGNASALSGLGTIGGNVTVMDGGTLRPGFSTGMLTVNGNVSFSSGSTFLVAATPTEASQLTAKGAATLGGAKVLVQGSGAASAFAPSTQYTILTAPGGGLGGTNTFGSVTSSLLFLTPSLTYDPTHVFLTLALNGGGTGGGGGGTGGGGSGGGGGGTGGGGTGGGTTSPGSVFLSAAQTRNQGAVAGALDAAVLGATPVGNPMLLALLNLTTATDPRQAFNALSGELFGSVQNTQATHMHFMREAMLGRMRQASYSYDAPDGLGALSFGGPELAYAGGETDANAMAAFPAKAPGCCARFFPRSDLLGAGSRRLGSCRQRWQCRFGGSRFGGFLSGADARLGETWRGRPGGGLHAHGSQRR